MTLRLIVIWIVVLLLPITHSAVPAAGQNAPCGIVEALDYPIDGIVQTYDDFGLYRPRFGGNHVGLDIGFGRWGDPVRAVARGRVTYSDVEGWGTEKGVVVVEHTFPDGSIYYSLYGHVEQSDTIFLPKVGECVERGQVIAGIGYPSRGAPHLHYEIRDFLPDDGGPGYVTGSPLAEGWYHPLDFTLLWRARLSPAFISYATFGAVPTLPPVVLENGMVIVASGNLIEGVLPPNVTMWRVETDGVITGIAALPGDRVVAHTRSGQTVVLQGPGGRYAALWTVYGPDQPFVLAGGALVFVTQEGGLAAYDTAGEPLWTMPGGKSADETARVVHFEAGENSIGFGVLDGNATAWRMLDMDGQVLYETRFRQTAIITAAPGGGWLALDGGQLVRIADGERQPLAEISPEPGRMARLAVDGRLNVYMYLGDGEQTLLSLDAAGETRWRVRYPSEGDSLLPPLMLAQNDCLLYSLDVNGVLNLFDSRDGTLLNQMQLYAGGIQSSSPRARLLELDAAGNLRLGSGFLTMVTVDGWVLGGMQGQGCPAG